LYSVENLWLCLLKLLHELSREIRVLNHPLSNHWETWIANQCLNCLKSGRIKIVLAESSHSCITFISLVSIIWFLTLCTSSGRYLRNMSAHQKFEGNIWNILSSSQSLNTQLSWFSRNAHQLINSCLNFWRESL
jgi:hypothetical protein